MNKIPHTAWNRKGRGMVSPVTVGVCQQELWALTPPPPF